MVDDGNVAACIAHIFVDLPPPPIDAVSLDFEASPGGGAAASSRGRSGSSAGVPSAVRSELEPTGICEAVRRRACEVLSASGVDHCTIQCVPMLPLEALSVAQAEVRAGKAFALSSAGMFYCSAHNIYCCAGYIDQAGAVDGHWTRQWSASVQVPTSLTSPTGGMRARSMLDDSSMDRAGGF